MPLYRYFLDTSGLIDRFLVRATGHAWVRDICDPSNQNTIIIAQITGAELAAALHQLVRGGILKKKRCEQLVAGFWDQVSGGEYRIVPITADRVRHAADLCATHPLRGYDAVQLACALTSREDARLADVALMAIGSPPIGDPVFVTEDKKLQTAAQAAGFRVESPKDHP